MKPNANKNRIPDYLFHIAQGFYEIGLSIACQVHKDNSIKGFQRISPAVVNFAFAIELMLKGLHSLTTKMNLKGHKLWNLYKHLSKDIKQDIENKYNKYKIIKSDDLSAIRIEMKKEKRIDCEDQIDETNENTSLKDLLLNHNNAFEDWRYLYEIPPTNYTYEFNFKLMDAFIKSLIEAINDVKSKIKPTFIVGKVK